MKKGFFNIVFISALMQGCSSISIPHNPHNGVLVDTGASLSVITMPESGIDNDEIVRFARIATGGGVVYRPVVMRSMSYAGCSQVVEVSIRESDNDLASVILGRNWISKCGFSVHVRD